VVLPPKDHWVGAKSFDQFNCKFPDHNLDFCIYDFKKWLNLTVAMNPNVCEMLYVNETNPNIIVWTKEWDAIRTETKKLANQRAFVGFHGYATSQLKKMSIKQANKTGRQYITEAMGFDTKFAAHGFRLIYQGEELMLKNEITFPRPEADLLKSIRNGIKYRQNQQAQCIKDWEIEQKRLDRAKENTCLPEKADFNSYNNLLMETFDSLVNVH
jgi:predicted nucleotidyltransferase